MKCPYIVNIEQAYQDTYEHDEAGNTTFHSNKLVEKRTLIDCLKEECAVWVNGSCRYYCDRWKD